MLVIGAALALMLGAQTPAPASGAEAARVTYARSFKGSVPAFVQIAISQDGAATATVREHDADAPQTLQFTASTAAVQDIFAKAAALHDFTRPTLEAKQKVAYTGDKMLAFDDAAHHSAQQFNFTAVAPAVALEARFEHMATTAVDALELERAMRFQPLNTLGVLEQIEQDQSAGRLGEPQIIERDLKAAAANPVLMDASRHHAAGILKALHAEQP
ncbi:MAG TPA: hypothetical protein VNE83_01550 [Terriglobales bacterium]|nr:hypothetical protein [Terriglobales bacterium]